MNLFTFCTLRQPGRLKLVKISGNRKYLKYCFKMVFVWQIQNKQLVQIVPYNGVTFISIVRFVISPLIPVVFRHIRLVISITFPLREWAVFLVTDVLNLKTYLKSKPVSPENRADTAEVLSQNCTVPKLRTLSRNKEKNNDLT